MMAMGVSAPAVAIEEMIARAIVVQMLKFVFNRQPKRGAFNSRGYRLPRSKHRGLFGACSSQMSTLAMIMC